jgi:hypothetical protein
VSLARHAGESRGRACPILQEQVGADWSLTLQAVQQRLKKRFWSDGACDRPPQGRTTDTKLPGHPSNHVVADLSAAGPVRDMCYRNDLSVVPAGEVRMASCWI